MVTLEMSSTESCVRDRSLSNPGFAKIHWAESRMEVLKNIQKRFEEEKPLRGTSIGACLHITKETAVLIGTLKAGGADISLAACNPLSTQDDIAAALVKEGIHVFAFRGETDEQYWSFIDRIFDFRPNILIDDGADLIVAFHKKEDRSSVVGGTENTTSGVLRLGIMKKFGVPSPLKIPVIAVNNAITKHFFDNRYGTGQSAIEGIIRATSVILAGKIVVVAGYGWVGRGIALRAKAMGSNVIVTEVDYFKSLEAIMDGFRVMPMAEAAKLGDIFITATGNIHVIRKEHIEVMKDKAILCNAGHFDIEINKVDLAELSSSERRVRENVDQYILKDGRRVYLLAEGRLVNLICADGHPIEVMDLTFSNQALSVEYLVKKRTKLENELYDVPFEIDQKVAKEKLALMGIQIDLLSEAQKEYVKGQDVQLEKL